MARILIVGGGLAGLYAALKLAPLPVTLVTAPPITKGSSSAWAQGGIAAALGAEDSLEDHIFDTINAGGALVKANIVRKMVTDAPARIADLAAMGVPFDRGSEGEFSLGREGAHSFNRIVKVTGDRAGAAIMNTIKKQVLNTPSINVIEGFAAYDLVMLGHGDFKLSFAPIGDTQTEHLAIVADHVILATGGIGGLYAVTTNPVEARGEGMALAAKAGALITDTEFVQFHPTAFDLGRDPAPLATEALRGEGAVLVNELGARFMVDVHPLAELAPRDILARAIHGQILSGHKVFLDAREAIGDKFKDEFPTVFKTCVSAGINPLTDVLPVAPAAHYHMGGVEVDEYGQSSLSGLWVSGELACTGVHGSNRLASNSLLETLFLSNAIAERIKTDSSANGNGARIEPRPFAHDQGVSLGSAREIEVLRKTMTNKVGVVRNEQDLADGLDQIKELEAECRNPQFSNISLAARLIIEGALARTESRGAHYREDYPDKDERQAAHRKWKFDAEKNVIFEIVAFDSSPLSNQLNAPI